MTVAKGVWGIDIGQCALKAIRLELADGRPTVTAFDYVEHAKILSQPDADPDSLIREALDKFLSRNQVKLDEVAIGIAGQSGLARFVKLPPVEEKKIAEIVKFEAKQQIPFPLDEVVWDYQKIAGGDAVDGFALETEIGLFAMKRDVIARYLGYFNASKIEVHTVQMSPLALVNFATFDLLRKGGAPEPEAAPEDADDTPKGKKRCAVVMDIGTDASNLIITDGAKIIWQRPIPLGGNNFTRALTKELKLTFAKAEHLKRNAAKSPEMASILKAIKPVLTDFVGEVQRSLGYFTNTHRDAHVAYMVGLGSAFKLPGLQKYLSDKLSLEVRKPTQFNRLLGDAVLADPLFQETVLTFPVAYGLALQGLGLARLSTNLLPQEIRMDRLIRAKKPYGVAAAALLLVGTVAMAWGYSEDLSRVTDKRIADAEQKAKAAADRVGQQEGAVTAKLGDSAKLQNDGKLIIAGNDERLNWPRFFEVQTAAMPRPGDNGNLTAREQVEMWKGAENAGVEALAWFERRMRTGVPIDQALQDANSENPKNLAMVNVEAVHTRWVNDPKAFLDTADTAVLQEFRENIAKYMAEGERERVEAEGGRLKPAWKGEPGGAWVVEIRGYTDHKDGPNFLQACLIKNLQKMDSFARDEGKVGTYVVGVPDPVKGKVSHPFIYKVWPVADPQPNTFVNIGTSYLNKILGRQAGGADAPPVDDTDTPAAPTGPIVGAPTAPAGGPAAAGTAAPVNLAPIWRGLTEGSAGKGNVGGPAPGTPQLGVPVGTPATDPKQPKNTQPTKTRYEFVVMLIWREPIMKGNEGQPKLAPSAAPAGGPPTGAPPTPPAQPAGGGGRQALPDV